MAHSARNNLPAVLLLLVLLLVAIAAAAAAAAAGGRIHAAESAASVEGIFPCNEDHLSGNYKGPCFGLINDKACNDVCLDESSDNISGECNFFQCWCRTRCNSETALAAAASAPIPA